MQVKKPIRNVFPKLLERRWFLILVPLAFICACGGGCVSRSQRMRDDLSQWVMHGPRVVFDEKTDPAERRKLENEFDDWHHRLGKEYKTPDVISIALSLAPQTKTPDQRWRLVSLYVMVSGLTRGVYQNCMVTLRDDDPFASFAAYCFLRGREHEIERRGWCDWFRRELLRALDSANPWSRAHACQLAADFGLISGDVLSRIENIANHDSSVGTRYAAIHHLWLLQNPKDYVRLREFIEDNVLMKSAPRPQQDLDEKELLAAVLRSALSQAAAPRLPSRYFDHTIIADTQEIDARIYALETIRLAEIQTLRPDVEALLDNNDTLLREEAEFVLECLDYASKHESVSP